MTMGTQRSWSEQDQQMLRELRAPGTEMPWVLIAERMGRPAHACRTKFLRMNMTPEQRKALYAKKSGASYRTEPAPHYSTRLVPDQQALADRDYRANLQPLSITAWFFGDPLPGYSALERA